MYEEYKKDIQFVIVYIREAHPELLPEGNKTGIVGRPKNLDERIILATDCATKYKFHIPMVIDGMEGKVNEAYQAVPVRVTITDIDGKTVYYAGPGPFDYRPAKVERVLAKLAANHGRMPPAPPPAWGKPEGGLRLGLGLDPPNPAPGEEVSVLLHFENAGKKPLYVFYSTRDPFGNLAVENEKGERLVLVKPPADPKASSFSRMMSRGGFRIFPRKLAPGERFQTDFTGRVPAAGDSAAARPGRYEAVYTFAVSKKDTARIRRYRDLPYWEGQVTSGAFGLAISRPKAATCMSCHGVEDYHHAADLDCSLCHVGKEGSNEYPVKEKACAKCHPREGVRGRPMIPSSGLASLYPPAVHPFGRDDDGLCLRCHDKKSHQKGVVRLVDPRTGKSKPFSEFGQRFCLGCHGASPPAGVAFPESKGSGFDESAFSKSKACAEGRVCTDCHAVHGSPFAPLLKKEGLKSPH